MKTQHDVEGAVQASAENPAFEPDDSGGTKQIADAPATAKDSTNPALPPGAEDATSPDQPSKAEAATKSVQLAASADKARDNHDGLTGLQLIRQVFVGVMVAMVTVSTSANSAAAVILPQLNANGTEIPITPEQGTWFASAHTLSATICSTMGGMAVHHLGPRRVMLLQVIPTVAGWLMMTFANGYPMLLVGRCLVGACTGFSLSAGQVYTGEASSPQIRGRLVCISGVFNNLGSILSYVVGYVLPWRWVPAAPVILFLVPGTLGMLLVPESPYWLLGKQKHKHARRSLRSLRGDPAVADRDMEIMTEASKHHQKPLSFRELAGEMKKLSVLAPFLTITVLFILRVMAGIMPVLTYTVIIFQETGSALNAYQSSILFGCVRLFNSICCVLYVSDRFGRRPLLIFSGVGCTLTSLCLAVFLFSRDQTPDWTGWQHISWLPLPIILLYVVAFDFGFARTGWVVHAEIFPSRVRSALSGFAVFVHYAGSFVSILVFPYIWEAFTLAGAFCFFALSSFLGLLLIIFFIPETKNQRLETIEAFYVKRFDPHHKKCASAEVGNGKAVQQ